MITIEDLFKLQKLRIGIHACRVKYEDLDANIFEDGYEFCATSDDDTWCCIGVIEDHYCNIADLNPTLRVNKFFKNID